MGWCGGLARTIQDFIHEAPTKYSPEVVPILENLDGLDHGQYLMENDAYSQAANIAGVIRCHINTPRQGPTDNFTLEHLRSQAYWR
jgi:hypothetical protein